MSLLRVYQDNILNFDLIVLVNVKTEARKSQFTETLRLLN